MWNPSHVQFTVLRARNLISKGKGGNNDVFVTIQLGKEKYQTSTIKNAHNPEWFEECDLPIPHMHSEVEVNLYHRGLLSDDFLGYCSVPLWDYKVGERPKSQWVNLKQKPSKQQDNKLRGELEVKLTFHVESRSNVNSGLKKRSSSIKSLATAVGDKLGFSRSKSFRENRKDPEGSKSERRQWPPAGVDPHFREDKEASSAYLRRTSSSHPNLRHVGRTPVPNFPALDLERARWNANEQAEMLSRSYSMSAAYIKSMSLDRGTHNFNNNHTQSQEHIHETTPVSHMINVPGSRRSCVEFSNYTIPPPPYLPQQVTQDDSAILIHGAMRSAPRTQLQTNPSFAESIRKRERSMYESIKERTEPESSSTDDEVETGLSRARPRRLIPRENREHRENRANDADIESICDGRQGRSQNGTPEPGEVTHVGLDNGRRDSNQLGLENSRRDSNPSLVNGHNKEERPVAPSRRKLVSVKPNMSFSPPPVPQGNGQMDVVLRKKSKRDRLKKLNQYSRRFTVQGLDYRSSGLYDESLSDLSDSARHSGPDIVQEDLFAMYKNLSKEELVRLVIQNKAQMIRKDRYIGDLESYIDDLLVRVMETQPKLLQRARPPRR